MRETSTSWRSQALCRDTSVEVFFAPERERSRERAKREAKARAICRHCPVLTECRAFALGAEEAHGIWGGLSEDERERLRATNRVGG